MAQPATNTTEGSALRAPAISIRANPDFEAAGGGFEGAQLLNREGYNWRPLFASPDQAINLAKSMSDARGRDIVQNDGYANGAVQLHRDNAVGSHFRATPLPDWRALGFDDDKWATEFADEIGPKFNLLAEAEDNYLDASGRNDLTGMLRLATGGFVMTGEVLATCEWITDKTRPLRTAIQLISPERLCNPNGQIDNRYLRRGIERDDYGRATAYWIRQAFPTEFYDMRAYTWQRVAARKPWGRQQVIHIAEPLLEEQSRGISEMVGVLKTMRMTKNFQEITLQNAVVNASYAATIESDLPPDVVYQAMGGMQQNDGWLGPVDAFMKSLGQYVQGASNIAIDGTKIPHLFPGTKLNMKPMGNPGGVGGEFEKSLLRHICASLGISYEEFSRDFSQVSYSAARASMLSTWKYMQSRKKAVPARLARIIYSLVLEEWNSKGDLPLPAGKRKSWFYEPMVKNALCKCTWLGAGQGQIDELKETQAAVMRISAGLSTYEEEIGRRGQDWRQIFEQRAKEAGVLTKLGLVFDLSARRTVGQTTESPSDPMTEPDTASERDTGQTTGAENE